MPIPTKKGVRKGSNIGFLVEQMRRTPEGEELLHEIDQHCAFSKTVFDHRNARQSDFNSGKQSVANWLHSEHEKYRTKVHDEK